MAVEKFGRLTAIEQMYPREKGNRLWLCLCDCGQVVYVLRGHLTNRHTKSCGCLARELVGNRARKHGFRKTRFYNTWCQIKQRQYKRGRIEVCDRWKDFELFKKDMYQDYVRHVEEHGESNTTIDRVDNEKGYSPDNCRWATYKVQSFNRHYTVKVDLDGEVVSLREAAKRSGIKYKTVWQRINAYGWSMERALGK
jgi:hypothetical protein